MRLSNWQIWEIAILTHTVLLAIADIPSMLENINSEPLSSVAK